MKLKKTKEINVEGQSEVSKRIIKLNINEMSSDSNLDLIKIKEKQAHEIFIKYQKENPQHDQNEWRERPSLRKATPKVNNRAENQRINYLETKTKITKDMTIEMAERIMAGKSPYVQEKVKILYLKGFKKNRIGYTRAVLCQAGLPKDALLSISYIGLSILEVIIKQPYVNKMVEIGMSLKGIWMKDFNPLLLYKEAVNLEVNGEKKTPRQAFDVGLSKIIEQGRRPIKIIRSLRTAQRKT
jgi:hypothetical protein